MMMIGLKVLWFLCTIVLCQVGNLAVAQQQRKQAVKSPADLRRDIFKNYDPKVIPVRNQEDFIPTKVSLTPLFIREVVEGKEILELDAWFHMTWEDHYLAWDPDTYGGIKSLNLPSEEVWKPDITAYTASPDMKLLPRVATKVIVNNTGNVMWVPPLTVSSRCPLDYSGYPDDIQLCVIRMGSWTYSDNRINLQLFFPTPDMQYFKDNNPEWSMVSITSELKHNYYPCCPGEDYPTVDYNVTLKRKSAPNVKIADSVSMFAVFLGLLMFWLPPDSLMKLLMGGLAEVLLGITALCLGAVIQSPIARLKAAERVYPCMCVVAGAMILEILILNLARVMGPCRPPRCILYLAKGCCQPFCVCISRPYPGGDLRAEMAHTDKSKKHSSSAQEEWNLVAMALDRVFFITALVFALFYHYIYK